MKPATPLPWFFKERGQFSEVQDATGNTVCDDEEYFPFPVQKGDQRYIVHAANNYPKLVEALREVYEIEEGPGETDRPQWQKVRALLRELGEDA